MIYQLNDKFNKSREPVIGRKENLLLNKRFNKINSFFKTPNEIYVDRWESGYTVHPPCTHYVMPEFNGLKPLKKV